MFLANEPGNRRPALSRRFLQISRMTFRRVFRNAWHIGTRSRAIRVRRPRLVSRAAPSMVDALRRVRRCMSRRVICRFVFDPFHYCAFRERATPDAPETIDDQRRCTGCRDRTIYGGSRGSASLPSQTGLILALLDALTPVSPLTSHLLPLTSYLLPSSYGACRRYLAPLRLASAASGLMQCSRGSP